MVKAVQEQKIVNSRPSIKEISSSANQPAVDAFNKKVKTLNFLTSSLITQDGTKTLVEAQTNLVIKHLNFLVENLPSVVTINNYKEVINDLRKYLGLISSNILYSIPNLDESESFNNKVEILIEDLGAIEKALDFLTTLIPNTEHTQRLVGNELFKNAAFYEYINLHSFTRLLKQLYASDIKSRDQIADAIARLINSALYQISDSSLTREERAVVINNIKNLLNEFDEIPQDKFDDLVNKLDEVEDKNKQEQLEERLRIESRGEELENQITATDEQMQQTIGAMINLFDIKNFSNLSADEFRKAEVNVFGLRQILKTIDSISNKGMSILESEFPGDVNKILRIQILEVALNSFAKRFNRSLENLFLGLTKEINVSTPVLAVNSEEMSEDLKVNLGVQGVGKGTIASSNVILKNLLSGEQDTLYKVDEKEKKVSGLKAFRAGFNKLGQNVKDFLKKKLGVSQSESNTTYSFKLSTGTGGMFNPKKPNPEKPSIYDPYYGNVGFAGQFVKNGLMVGDELTHMMVMVEYCLAALEARRKGATKLEIESDVYPRTAKQVEKMKSLESRMDKGTLDMSNFFGFTEETLQKHLQHPRESKSAALAWGVMEGLIKVPNTLINDLYLQAGIKQNLYKLIEDRIEDNEFKGIVNQLKKIGEQEQKFQFLSSEEVRNNKAFWNKVKETIIENNERLRVYSSDYMLAIMQTAMEKELAQPKYNTNRNDFITDTVANAEFIRDYINQTVRSLDLIAERIVDMFRVDDVDFFGTLGRMASNDRDSLPNLFDKLDHYGVGYTGGEAYIRYIEQLLAKNVPDFDENNASWKQFRPMLSKLHEEVTLGDSEEIDFALEA